MMGRNLVISFLHIWYLVKFLNMGSKTFQAIRLLTGLFTSSLNKFYELTFVFLYKNMYLLHVKKSILIIRLNLV